MVQKLMNRIEIIIRQIRQIKPAAIWSVVLSDFKDRWLYATIGGLIFLSFLFFFGGLVNTVPLVMGIVLFITVMIIFFTGKKLQRDAFIIILSFGIIFSLITPILDTPDETAHLARAMYLAEGKLTVSNLDSELLISEDYKLLKNQSQKTILVNTLNIPDSDVQQNESNGLKATNAYSFISYIPQAIGIELGRLVNLSVLWTFYLGRMINVLFYAIMVSMAIRLAPVFKKMFFVVGAIPMAIYIAASYNQDAFGIGIIFVTFAYFLYLLNKANHSIGLLEVASYTGLCMLITLTKFPFVLLILLLVFIPRDKYQKRWIYRLGFLAIVLTAMFAVVWMKSYSAIPHPFLPAGVNMKEQLQFFIRDPIQNSQIFGHNLIEGITNYLMLFNFGWLTYGSNGIGLLYLFFLGSISVFYPREFVQSKLARFGSLIVILGIYMAIELSMYLTWTPVGSTIINGVQGRYFIGFLPIIPFLLNIGPSFEQLKPSQIKQYDVMTTIVPIYFIIISLALTIKQYY